MKRDAILLFVILMFTIIITHGSATTIVYPSEYFTLQNQSEFSIETIQNDLAEYYQLERININLEIQNQLLAQQVESQWVETCYTSHVTNSMSTSNFSAWENECDNAGYPLGK